MSFNVRFDLFLLFDLIFSILLDFFLFQRAPLPPGMQQPRFDDLLGIWVGYSVFGETSGCSENIRDFSGASRVKTEKRARAYLAEVRAGQSRVHRFFINVDFLTFCAAHLLSP